MVSELEAITRKRRKELDIAESESRQNIFRAYDIAIDGIRADLLLVTKEIDQARANGDDVNPDWLRRQFRYQRLINQASVEFQRFSDDGLKYLDAARLPAVSGGAQLAWESIEAVGINTDTFAGNINRQALERLSSSSVDGPLRDVMESHGTENVKTIQNELFKGIASGKGANAILASIMEQIMEPNKRRLAAMVRTEMMRSFNASLAEQYSQVDHLLEGYRWVAAKSPRTCLACLSRDGKIYKTYQTSMHVNDRCLCSPVPKGSTYDYQTGDQWLAQQDPNIQQKMFPTPDAWLAYSEGKVKLADFSGVKKNKIWGDSIYEKSWKSVADKKGLPYRSGEVG